LRRPTADLIHEGEGAFVEFKESARWSHIQGDKEKLSELDVIRTLAGFMNAMGGTLLIGVHDTDGPVGLVRDYKSLQKRPQQGWV
jgi:ATP-dependent Lon protease